MIVVVDASVAAKWFVREALHDEALDVLDHPDQLHSLDLMVAAVTNIAWKKALRGEIGIAQATEMERGVRQGNPLLYPSALFNERALEIGLQLQHPIYDCLYLACAEALKGILMTADQKFCRKAHGAGFENMVHYLGAKPISAIIAR